MMTPEHPSRQVKAPRYDKPMSRDRVRATNGLYTPMCREGALPSSVVVIPDTSNILYSVEKNINISDLYSIGSLRKRKPRETSIPFVHGVELNGPKGEKVRF